MKILIKNSKHLVEYVNANQKYLFRKFSEKNSINTNSVIKEDVINKNNTENQQIEIIISENKKFIIDSKLSKQLEKINKVFPIENLDQQAFNDIIKYKIFEDSLSPTVENLKENVPEINGHIEFNNWVNSIIEENKQEETMIINGIVILKQKSDVLIKYGIDPHHYKNYQDKDYEVDIEEVLNKDLFAKQRIIDNYVEENKEKIEELIGFYKNRIKKATSMNKYSYLIYQNNYINKMKKLKLNLAKSVISCSLISGLFYLINPYMLILLIPEYITLLYSFHIMNNLVDQIILYEDKQSIIIRKFNFLGFRRETPSKLYNIKDLNYSNKLKNFVLNLNSPIFFISKLIKNLKSDNNVLDDFRIFHKLKYLTFTFYIPADSSQQHLDTNEKLILAIFNNDLKFISEYDYSIYEDRLKSIHDALEAYKKEYAKKNHTTYYSEEDKLKMKYSKFLSNRDYSDNKYNITFKRKDDLDGTYIDNGYR